MPTSARGNSARSAASGFTLIEMLVVVAIVAIGAGLVALALRDPAETRLEVEAARLAALLESARVESRSSGAAAYWLPATDADAAPFRFVGLAASLALPTRWLDDRVSAQVVGAQRLVLGPEAILPPQRIVLRLEDRRIEIGSDGLAPFSVLTTAAAP